MHHAEEAEAQVKALKAMLQKHPDEADGWRLLAEAELIAENYVAAETAADEALKRAPKLPRALLAKGWAMLQKADAQARTKPEDWKTARGWIIKANRETPNDPLILTRFYQSFIIEGTPLPQAAKDGLWRAYTLSPEEPNLRLMLAQQLFEENKFDGAITLVAPLAYGPHPNQSTRQMQAFIERIKRRKAGLPDENENAPDA
jgi:cytochrome c-type biogenesis protein CcmH/NrfG